MKDVPGEWVIVARFGRPHGVKGLVSVISFTEPADNILLYPDWYIAKSGQWSLINIAVAQTKSEKILVQVEGYENREQVALLTNVEIAVPRDLLPTLESGEYYWHDLIGMQVSNSAGHILGRVIELMPTGANDVLVVQGEKRCLLPYLPGQVILNVDMIQKTILVDWEEDF